MDALQPSVGNIFVQASKLFSIAQNQGQRLLGDNFSLSNVALATAALGSALTANGGAEGKGDLYLNQLGAEKLNAQVGDMLKIFVGPIPIPCRVKAIVAEAGPVGVLMPVVMMRLDEAQKIFFMHDKVNNVLISNQGDELSGLAQTTMVSDRLKVLALDPVVVEQLAAILRRPAVRAVLDPAAARIVEQTNEEIDAPPIIANLVKNLANVGTYQLLKS